MSVFTDSHNVSFRNVPFLVRSETSQGGKKHAIHNFVNSDKKYVETLGKIPPTFTLECVVFDTATESGIQRRLNLERVLNIAGVGELVHPIYGPVQVESTTFSVSSNQTRVGEFVFSINFETSTVVTATAALANQNTVTNKKDAAQQTVTNALSEKYETPTFVKTHVDSAEQMISVYDTVLQSVSGFVGGIQDNISNFTSTVQEAKSDIFAIVQQGENLKNSLDDLYLSFSNIANTPQDLKEAWRSMTDFALLDDPLLTDTFINLQVANNINLINEQLRVVSLINYFEAVAYEDFQTDVELSEAIADLDSKYNLMFNVSPGALALDADVRTKMAELLVTAREVLDQKSESVFRVVEIDQGRPTSMALTNYRYYGTLDNIDLISAMNTGANLANFNAPIKAVSS